jgi:hypothetical protein
MFCLRMNYNRMNQQGTFNATWEQSTTTLTGEGNLITAILNPVQDRSVKIGGPGRPVLKNDGTSFETGLTVAPGALVEITPSYLVFEKRVLDLPVTSISHKNVCLASEPMFETRCRSIGGGCPRGGCERETVCNQVQVGTKCTRVEDQWVKTTTYATQEPQFYTQVDPNGTVETLYEGLSLKFTWGSLRDGNLKSIICPMNIFERKGDGISLIVRLENKPTCQIFTPGEGGNPMLHLVNEIHNMLKYKKGRDIVKWNGEMLERAETATYDSQVQFAGTVGIRGFDWMSALSDGGKK